MGSIGIFDKDNGLVGIWAGNCRMETDSETSCENSSETIGESKKESFREKKKVGKKLEALR